MMTPQPKRGHFAGRRLTCMTCLTRLTCLVALAAWHTTAVANPAVAHCGEQLTTGTRQQAAGGGYQLAWVANAWPVPVGRHFSIDFVLCAPPGAAVPAGVRVDADMPAHRHGMNYRATVTPMGGGQFKAEGLMFHMAGRWRVIFDIEDAAPPVRITHEVLVQ